MSNIRVRFAPSPTGYLHVGGARTALYNYLFAKHHGGKFILRIEDTDEARSTEDSLRMQISDLKWLGLKWDEGPNPETLQDEGPFGPYRQSRRQDIYRRYAEQLLNEGRAFYDFMTDEEIEVQRQAAISAGRPPHVESPYRDWTLAQAKERLAKGEPAAVRFKVQEKRDFVLKDLVRGEVTFPSDMVGDFVILRSSGMPVYNFCCVVDDALMEISHVFRAEEHLSNSLRQMMLYQALGFKMPEFGHISLILGADKQKLSKRHGATSCHEYNVNGFLPEALNNFLALLGWSSPNAQEIMSIDEMIAQFSVERLHAAPAVFDETKLSWVNATHLRALSDAELWTRVAPFLEGLDLPTDEAWRARSLEAFKTSMTTLKEAFPLYELLSTGPLEITAEGQDALSWPTSRGVIEAWRSGVAAAPDEFLTEAEFNALQDRIKDAQNVKGKPLFQAIRVAVIGKPQGTELKMLVPLLHKSTLVKRAEHALARIKA